MATPSTGGKPDSACCTAQQKAARALHRTAPDTTADCAVPPLFIQSTKPELVAFNYDKIGIPRPSMPCQGIEGMAMRESGR
jgi:hypothetical protein